MTLPHSRKNLTADTGMEFNLQAARVPSSLKAEIQTLRHQLAAFLGLRLLPFVIMIETPVSAKDACVAWT